MNRQIIKLSIAGLIFLLSANIYASNEKEMLEVKDRPIDDAKEMIEVKDRPVDDAKEMLVKADTIKGGDASKDHYHEIKISLKSIKEGYQISRKDLLFPPYRCFIYHDGGTETEIETSNTSVIDFKVNKSLLTGGDYILVTNALDVKDKNNPIKKFVIEEILILK